MIKNNPKVSIIIPTYNRSAFLEEAIKSVLNQSYKNIEIIIVDDGSTDDTRELVRAIKDKRIIYLFQKNRGRSVARNNGIEKATGKYLAFLDDDDLFLSGKVKKQVEILENHTTYSMVYTSAYNINANNKLLNTIYKAKKSGNIYKDVALYLPLTIILPSVMVRKDVVTSLNGFDEKMERFEDTDMWRRIAKRYLIYAIEDPLVKVRYHQGNQLKNHQKLYQSINYYVMKVLREDSDKGMLFLRKKASNLYLHYAIALSFQKPPSNYKILNKLIKKTIVYNPFRAYMYFYYLIAKNEIIFSIFIQIIRKMRKTLVYEK